MGVSMVYDPDKHHRRSIRLPSYDYASVGAYFATVCAHDRARIFGEVADGAMHLARIGNIVDECLKAIPEHFENVIVDAAIVMPNHVHVILVIAKRDERARGITGASGNGMATRRFIAPGPGSVGTILGTFKAAATREVNQPRVKGFILWQRSFYERVIRNDREMNAFREYIELNPLNWRKDEHHVEGGKQSGFQR